jgi:hypothetical protein
MIRLIQPAVFEIEMDWWDENSMPLNIVTG